MHTLRPYQLAITRAVLDSVVNRRGLTFTVEIARQGGKNETSAHLELILLTIFGLRGGAGLKTAPTFRPQVINSLQRLKDCLRSTGLPWSTEYGYQVNFGNARWLFFSGAEVANVVGATASILLEADEAQDLDPDKWERDFRPMGAAGNVTSVLWGTPWAGDDLLQLAKHRNLELERHDGVRRHFRCDWREVGRYNPAYLAYVQSERERLGPTHPLFLTQYDLQTLDDRRRMFSRDQLTLLRGGFPAQDEPDNARYVAGLDVAGAAESPEEAGRLPSHVGASRAGPGAAGGTPRDSTVLTIGALRNGELHIVALYAWQNVPHHTATPAIRRLFEHWNVGHLVVDATGQGEAMFGYLSKALGRRVTPYVFTRPAKSTLAYDLLAWVNRGDLKLASGLAPDLFDQLALARTHVYPNRSMDFYVDPREGHDDALMSLALCVQAAQSIRAPRIARGRLPFPSGDARSFPSPSGRRRPEALEGGSG